MTVALSKRRAILRKLITVFFLNSISFPYFTNVVQILCSLSGWLHLNCSSIGTGFNGAETNCRIETNLGIIVTVLLFFSAAFVMSVQISIAK